MYITLVSGLLSSIKATTESWGYNTWHSYFTPQFCRWHQRYFCYPSKINATPPFLLPASIPSSSTPSASFLCHPIPHPHQLISVKQCTDTTSNFGFITRSTRPPSGPLCSALLPIDPDPRSHYKAAWEDCMLLKLAAHIFLSKLCAYFSILSSEEVIKCEEIFRPCGSMVIWPGRCRGRQTSLAKY